MRHRLAVLVGLCVLALGATASAYAFDCIRVSTSLQGLVQSTSHSGNWLLFDLSSPDAVQEEFGVTAEQAACVVTEYAKSGQPQFFALGVGVAGGRKESTPSQGLRAQLDGFGVIAWHNGTGALGDGKGIDHFEDGGILDALLGAAETCGVPVDDEG